MTPSDDDLSWLLRRELHAEAARLTPAPDGLGQIRGQLGSRSAWQHFAGGLRVDAERYGLHARHLAAEAGDAVLRLLRFASGRSGGERHGSRPGMVWLRPVVALAAVCIFAGTAAAVPGVRHAITTIGSSNTGSTTPVNGSGGGNGAGTGQRINGGGERRWQRRAGPGQRDQRERQPEPQCDLHHPGQGGSVGQAERDQVRQGHGEAGRVPGHQHPAGDADGHGHAHGHAVRPHRIGHAGAGHERTGQEQRQRQHAPQRGQAVPGTDPAAVRKGVGLGFVGRRLPPARVAADAGREPDSGQHAQHRASRHAQHADHLGRY